jgi:hypothetical protein
VLSPNQPATVSITIVRPALGAIETQLQLQAGQVEDLSLDDIGSGDYAVIIASDQPIVAGVRNSVGTDLRTDTSWVGSSYPLEVETVVAVPSLGDMRLSLVNPGDSAITVTVDGRQTLVAPGAMVSRPIPSGERRLAADGEFFAVVTLKSDTVIGHVQVLPAPRLQEPVVVRVR